MADLFARGLDTFTQIMNISGWWVFFFLVVQGDLWRNILNGKFASLLGENRHISLYAIAGLLKVLSRLKFHKSDCIKY